MLAFCPAAEAASRGDRFDDRSPPEAARNWSPDISLIDVIMQHVNGIDAAIAIGGMLPQCRILLISGDTASTDLLDEADALGHHFEILSKPFHPDMLIEKLQA